MLLGGLSLLLLWLSASSGANSYAPEVAVIEINEYQPPNATEPVLTQVILWEWHHGENSLHVAAWFIEDSCKIDTQRGWHYMQMMTGTFEGKRVRSRILRRTNTPHDPERLDQRRFPTKFRPSLEGLFCGTSPGFFMPALPSDAR